MNPHGTSGCKKIAVHADEMISSICLHNPHTHRGKMHPEHSFNHRALKAEVLSVRKHLNLRDFTVAKKIRHNAALYGGCRIYTTSQ